MADGFLGRWARRKEAVRRGEAVAPEEGRPTLPPAPAPTPASGRGSDPSVPPSRQGGEGRGEGRGEGLAEDLPPPPTLADVESLTPASDFSRFVRDDVDPAVKRKRVEMLKDLPPTEDCSAQDGSEWIAVDADHFVRRGAS